MDFEGFCKKVFSGEVLTRALELGEDTEVVDGLGIDSMGVINLMMQIEKHYEYDPEHLPHMGFTIGQLRRTLIRER